MLNPLYVVLTALKAVKIHDPDSSLVTSTAMADGDVPREITAATGLAFFGKGEFEDWSTFVEMIIDRADKMANSWRSGHVAAEGGLSGHGGVAHRWWRDVLVVDVEGGIWGTGGRSLEDGGIVTGEKRTYESGTVWPQLAEGYSWLKHGELRCRWCFKLRRRNM